MTSVQVWLLISIHLHTTYESGSPIVPVLKHVHQQTAGGSAPIISLL
jgi:hypothetical protein